MRLSTTTGRKLRLAAFGVIGAALLGVVVGVIGLDQPLASGILGAALGLLVALGAPYAFDLPGQPRIDSTPADLLAAQRVWVSKYVEMTRRAPSDLEAAIHRDLSAALRARCVDSLVEPLLLRRFGDETVNDDLDSRLAAYGALMRGHPNPTSLPQLQMQCKEEFWANPPSTARICKTQSDVATIIRLWSEAEILREHAWPALATEPYAVHVVPTEEPQEAINEVPSMHKPARWRWPPARFVVPEQAPEPHAA